MDCGKIVVHLCIVPLLPLKWYFLSMALVAKPQVASQYHFNEKPHTITDDTVSHHVIMVIFVLLAMGSIKNSTFSGMVYITTKVAKIVVSLVHGFTTLTPTYLPDTRVSLIYFCEAPPTS